MAMTTTNVTPELTHFINVYSQLNKDNLSLLNDLYHPLIEFQDPAHQLQGSQQLQRYFAQLYQNINYCHFTIEHTIENEPDAFVKWSMTFSHPKIKQGQQRTLAGCSQLRFKDQQLIYHRDYFDLGAMVYEGLPVIGNIIHYIKARLGA